MRILISAYACEPRRGSEPGAGWLWALAASAKHDVTVLTRRSRADAFRPGDLPERLELEFVDLPHPILRLVRGHERLYYTLWQFTVALAARRLHRKHPFDIVHHVTFANAWLPALACAARTRFVLGPVGGGTEIPSVLLDQLDRRGRLFEKVRGLARGINTYSPLIRLGWRRADVIVAQNHETVDALPVRYAAKAIIRPHSVVGPDLERLRREVPRNAGSGSPKALLSGRLLRWKGGAIAIHALCQTRNDWSLEVVGAGPAEHHLRSLVGQLGLVGRVGFTPWLSREELWRTMRDADVVIVPSLRDDAPLTIAEAQALGVPVVAFDQGGAAVMARLPGASISLVHYGSFEASALEFAKALDSIVATGVPRVGSDAFGVRELETYITQLYASVVASERKR